MSGFVDYFVFDEYSTKLMLSTLVGVYTAYYFFSACSLPKLYGRSPKLLSLLRSHVPFLQEKYSPFVFGFTGRVQTILRPIFHRVKDTNYVEECFSLPDGGEITLSWSDSGLPAESPIVVLLAGLTGCGCCHYIRSLVKELNNSGYRCVVANNRGTCSHKLTTPQTYCAAHTSDLALVVDTIKKRYPSAPMSAVGISLGGLILFNYVATFGRGAIDQTKEEEVKKACPLVAAMCVCMPWDLSQTSEKLEKSLDWLLFNVPLTYNLRDLIRRNSEVLSKKFDIPTILKCRSVKEFDQNLTVGMFGFDSVDDYYINASPVGKIDDITIPMLCFNSADDPFVPFESLPLEAVDGSANVVMALTRHGGHIGFLDGFVPTAPNFLDRAVKQYMSAVFDHGEELVTTTTASS